MLGEKCVLVCFQNYRRALSVQRMSHCPSVFREVQTVFKKETYECGNIKININYLFI